MIDLQPVTRREKRLLAEAAELHTEALVEPDSETSSEPEKQMNSVPVTTGGLPKLRAKSPTTTRSIPALVPEQAQPSKEELLRQIEEEEEKHHSAAEAFLRGFQQQAIAQAAKEREYQAKVEACEKHNARISRCKRTIFWIVIPAWAVTALSFVGWMGL